MLNNSLNCVNKSGRYNMTKFTNPERASEIIKEINVLRKELFDLVPEFQIEFNPVSYDGHAGDFVLVKYSFAEFDDEYYFYLDRDQVRRFKTREEGEAYIDFYKKEMEMK